jgi:hypothetical protein
MKLIGLSSAIDRLVANIADGDITNYLPNRATYLAVLDNGFNRRLAV